MCGSVEESISLPKDDVPERHPKETFLGKLAGSGTTWKGRWGGIQEKGTWHPDTGDEYIHPLIHMDLHTSIRTHSLSHTPGLDGWQVSWVRAPYRMIRVVEKLKPEHDG